jgi:hypothetical protein
MSRPRGPSTIRALNAALNAAVKAGLRVTGYKVNIHSGEIEVVTDKPVAQASEAGMGDNEWDTVLHHGKD